MELFYDAEQIRKLYDRRTNEYRQFCSTALDYLQIDDEKRENLNIITELDAFNYLSENTNARLVLYYVCLLSEIITSEEKNLLSESKEQFIDLFD